MAKPRGCCRADSRAFRATTWPGATDFIDYERQTFLDQHREWDIIFDAAGKSSYREAKRVLAAGGTYVSTEPSLRGLLMTLVTMPLQKHGRIMLARPRQQDLRELLRHYTNGELRVHTAEIFPLTAAAAAHRKIENESFCGKLVLNVRTE